MQRKRLVYVLVSVVGLAVLVAVGFGRSGPSPGSESLNKIWHGSFAAAQSAPHPPLKLLCWNIERGSQLSAISEFIQQQAPDIAVLQEVDLHARRTGQRNIAEELARSHGLNYVFGIEFEELGQGSRARPAYHGQALLTRLPIRATRVLRFSYQSDFWKPRWYLPNWSAFQRRLGGRMSLVVELGIGETLLVIYNAHLESRGSEAGRLRQIDELLADSDRYPPQSAIVVAGDLNTTSTSCPVLERLRQAGFESAIDPPQPTALAKARGSIPLIGSLWSRLRGRDHGQAEWSLDWIFVRRPLRANNGKVHHDVTASDHFPLTAQLRTEN